MTADRPVRIVRLSPGYEYNGMLGLQLNFLDQKNLRLIPSTRLYMGDALALAINSYGCMGEEPLPDLPVIGLFGDSIMQGTTSACLADHVKVPGHQAVNAGIEGSHMENTVDWVLELTAKLPMVFHAVHCGVHNLIYNDTTPNYWREQLDRLSHLPNVAHFKLSADINEEVVERGYEPFYTAGGYVETTWVRGGGERAAKFLHAVKRFNRFIETYCAETGRLLIDLHPVTRPRTYDDIAVRFSDVVHLREAYCPPAGALLTAQIAARMGIALPD